MEYFLQQLINGLTLGSIYGLIAIGYTMVYGIIGMINFAHGDIYMIGAFISLVAFLLLAALGITFVPLAIALVLGISVLFTAVYGWTVERIAYRPLRGAPRLAPLLGVDVGRVISMTFVMGAALAAVAGVMVTLYYGVIDFYIGFAAGIKAFSAAVLGGIGSLPGAMLGGFMIGLLEAFWSGYF